MYYYLLEESEILNCFKGGNWIIIVYSLYVITLEVDIMLFCVDDFWYYIFEF